MDCIHFIKKTPVTLVHYIKAPYLDIYGFAFVDGKNVKIFFNFWGKKKAAYIIAGTCKNFIAHHYPQKRKK